MKRFCAIFHKEFLQLLRSPILMAVLAICPAIIVCVIPFALGNDPKIKADIVDLDNSTTSRLLTERLQSSYMFSKVVKVPNYEFALQDLERTKINAVIVFPEGLEGSIADQNPKQIFVGVDATNTIKAQADAFHISGVLASGNIQKDSVSVQQMFNQEGNGRMYNLIALISLMLTIVGMSLMTLNIVAEKEHHIVEHVLLTGVSPASLIAAKLLFFDLIAIMELIIGLLLGHLIFGLEIAGSVIELIFGCAILLYPLLSMALFISAISKTQMQAIYMMIFLLVVIVLLSTMFSPLENMAYNTTIVCKINPLFWLIEAMRNVILKGFSIWIMRTEMAASIIFGTILSFFSKLAIKKIS